MVGGDILAGEGVLSDRFFFRAGNILLAKLFWVGYKFRVAITF